MKNAQKFILKADKKNQFYIIDIIRVIMALIILNFHCYRSYYDSTIPHSYYGGGWLVVDAFFMISGFFLAISAAKDNSPSYPKFMFRRIFKFLPFILLAIGQGVILSLVLWGIKGYSGCWGPVKSAGMGLWFILALCVSEFIYYPIIKYSKKTKYPLIALIMLIGLAGYIY